MVVAYDMHPLTLWLMRRAALIDTVARQLPDCGGSVVRAVVAELGNSAQALATHQAQVHGGGQRHQALVSADVRRGVLAADVLLAGLKS